MSGVPHQMDLRRRVEHGGIEVVGIDAGDGDSYAMPCMEQVRGRYEAKHQLERFLGRDWLQFALIMRVIGKPKIMIRRLAQLAMRSPEIPLGDVGGLAFEAPFK